MVRIHKYDLKDGLSNRQVNTIYKDKRGLLWIGTKYGLNSFDGYTFTNYTKEKNGLAFNYIDKILEDDAGYLWLIGPAPITEIAIFDPISKKTISFNTPFNNSKKYNFSGKLNDKQKTIYLLPDGENEIWIYRSSKGFYKKNISQLSLTSLLHVSSKNTIYAISKDSILLELDTAFKIKNKYTFNFRLKNSTNGARNNGFFIREGLKSPQPKIHYVSESGSIKFFQNNELPQYDTASIDFIFDTEIDNIIWRQGKLYKNNTLVSNFVADGYKDLSGNLRTVFHQKNKEIWIGNNFGLYKISIHKNKFKNYFVTSTFNEDNRNSYRGISVFNDKLYANNEAKGLCVFDLISKTTLITPVNKEFDGFTSLQIDGEKNIIQGCFHGVYKTSSANNTIKISSNGKRVWAMCKLNKTSYLVGTEKGIYLYDNTQNNIIPFTNYNGFKDLETAFVVAIIKNEQNDFYWICTDKGLFVLEEKNGITAHYSSEKTEKFNIPINNIHSIYTDKENIKWIASSEGLLKWDEKNNTKKIFTSADGLSDNTIYSIIEDNNSNLWLSSNYGLMCFNKKTCKTKTYLVEDGISNNEFNRISSFKDNNGYIYFGSLNGITSLHPKDFETDSTDNTSPFIITSFYQFESDSGKLINKTAELLQSKEIIIHPSDKLFTIDFVLLNYNYTEQNLYAYKIEGIENNWTYSKEHALSLSRLPYGKYTLHLKAKAVNSIWSDEIKIHIIVEKPFYLQAWFFLLLLGMIALSVYMYIILRTRQYKKTQLKLEAEVLKQTTTILEQSKELKKSLHQKEVLLKEIHHRVKNNLQVISGLLSLQSGDSQSNELKAIMKEGRNRVKSMALIHQMLYQNENLSEINFQDYLFQLTHQILSSFKGSNNLVTIKITSDNSAFDIDTAIPLGLIVNELVTNSIKYAFDDKGGKIDVILQKTDTNTFKLLVADSGKGLPQNFDLSTAQSLGLKLVKMLCAQIRATVNFTNDNGTLVEIIFKDTWKK